MKQYFFSCVYNAKLCKKQNNEIIFSSDVPFLRYKAKIGNYSPHMVRDHKTVPSLQMSFKKLHDGDINPTY